MPGRVVIAARPLWFVRVCCAGVDARRANRLLHPGFSVRR